MHAEPNGTLDEPAADDCRPGSPIEVDPTAPRLPLEWGALFPDDHPVEIEIGSGKGMFLKEAARAHPDRNYLGVERAGRFCRIAIERLTRAGLTNVRLLRADGLDLLDRWIAPGSIRALHIYFPDPWPKKRHRKRRLFRPALLDLAARALPEGAELFVATDHAEYGAAIRELFAATHDRFAPADWPVDEAERLPTNYALKWRRAGRALWWGRYRRLPDPDTTGTPAVARPGP
jgi:tRNA (guanine-N7-)-methyltransferase